MCDALPPFAFVDGFESYSAGPLYDAGEAVWIRAEQSRTGQITTTWARTGRHALELTSFSTSTETHYATLLLPERTSKLVLELVYTPDGFFVYKEFAMFGLARVTSRFALTPLATFDGDDHELWFIDARGTRTLVHDEIQYSRLGDSPIDNHIRVEFDFCLAEASVFIGAGEEAPTLRGTVPLPGAAEFDAFYVSGGVNPTFFDDIVIYTPGTEPDRSVLAP